MSRNIDRDRSRDRHGYRGRSQSPPDSNQKKKRTNHSSHQRTHHQSGSKPQTKRVKFNDVPDIKVFRKQDEPNSKGLTDTEIEEYLKKIQMEKGSGNFGNNNWEKMKHFDAQLENNSIKEQKQRQKILHEKLLAIKEEIPFYYPLLLRNVNVVSPGEGSTERTDLSARLNDVLACFYVQQSQIPQEPSFQIQNKSPSIQPKLISFDKQRIDNKDLTNTKKKQKKDQKPLKGILKMSPEERARERSESAPRKIDPNLINLLREMQINKSAYPKERAELLLKPYKDSGELDYLKNNPTILTQLMRSTSASNSVQRGFSAPPTAIPSTNPAFIQPFKQRISISPVPENPQGIYSIQSHMNPEIKKPLQNPMNYNEYGRPNYANYGQINPYGGYYMPQPQPQPTIIPHYPNVPNSPYQPQQQQNPYQNYSQPQQQQQQQQQQQGQTQQSMFNRNYKTVPCKYFHSPQGCVKATGCTFIHNQQYAGRATPQMLKSNRGMVMTNYNPNNPNDNMQMGNNFYQYPNTDYQGQH